MRTPPAKLVVAVFGSLGSLGLWSWSAVPPSPAPSPESLPVVPAALEDAADGPTEPPAEEWPPANDSAPVNGSQTLSNDLETESAPELRLLEEFLHLASHGLNALYLLSLWRKWRAPRPVASGTQTELDSRGLRRVEELAELGREVEQLRRQHNEDSAKLAEERTARNELDASLRQEKFRHGETRQERANMKAAVEDARMRLCKVVEDKQQLQHDKKQLKEQIGQQARNCSNAIGACREMRADFEELQADKSKNAQEIADLKRELKAVHRQLQHWQESSSAQQRRAEQLERDLAAAQAELGTLRAQPGTADSAVDLRPEAEPARRRLSQGEPRADPRPEAAEAGEASSSQAESGAPGPTRPTVLARASQWEQGKSSSSQARPPARPALPVRGIEAAAFAARAPDAPSARAPVGRLPLAGPMGSSRAASPPSRAPPGVNIPPSPPRSTPARDGHAQMKEKLALRKARTENLTGSRGDAGTPVAGTPASAAAGSDGAGEAAAAMRRAESPASNATVSGGPAMPSRGQSLVDEDLQTCLDGGDGREATAPQSPDAPRRQASEPQTPGTPQPLPEAREAAELQPPDTPQPLPEAAEPQLPDTPQPLQEASEPRPPDTAQPLPEAELQQAVRPQPLPEAELQQAVSPQPLPEAAELQQVVRPQPLPEAAELQQAVRPQPLPEAAGASSRGTTPPGPMHIRMDDGSDESIQEDESLSSTFGDEEDAPQASRAQEVPSLPLVEAPAEGMPLCAPRGNRQRSDGAPGPAAGEAQPFAEHLLAGGEPRGRSPRARQTSTETAKYDLSPDRSRTTGSISDGASA